MAADGGIDGRSARGAPDVDGAVDVDVVVIGAGFAGLYMLHRLRQAGFTARVLEAGGGVGGTWYWNRYPGARCDVESLEYSYGFDDDLQQDWEWTERYATQPEILRYLEHVADRFDLRRDIRFATRVTSATFDDDATTWTVRTTPATDPWSGTAAAGTWPDTTADVGAGAAAGTNPGNGGTAGNQPSDDGLASGEATTTSPAGLGDEAVDDATAASQTGADGDPGLLRCRFVVAATGCLSSANLPDIPGRDTFDGPTFHTGRWPHEGVDFTGKRVAVIGTGSSAVQSIPVIAEQAAELTVFQRTATYAVPAHNHPLPPGRQDEVKARYADVRLANRESAVGFGALATLGPPESATSEVDAAERERVFDARWDQGGLAFLAAFNDLLVTPDANELAADYVRAKIRDQVDDPAVADLLSPTQVIGCKRLCVDTGYYSTFNQEHVHLVDISSTGVDAITPTGVRAGGVDYAADILVFATGFDAMTGALNRIRFEGVGGRTLSDAWAEGPKTYLGLAVAGFPNLFLVTGPGSPSVLTNMVTSIEHHVEWIADCLTHLRTAGQARIEATQESVDQWVNYVNTVAGFTLFPTCNSWYLGANIPGKPRVFMPLPGFAPYAAQCTQIAASGYEGFTLSPA